MNILNFVLGVFQAFLRAFVTWKLYCWFLQPLGLPDITAFHLYGIGLFYGLWTLKSTSIRKSITERKESKEESEIVLKTNVYMIILISVVLLLGYLIK